MTTTSKRMNDLAFEVDFETDGLEVYHNSSGEVFVKNKISNVTMRIGDYSAELHITASYCEIEPFSFNGLSGFKIKSRNRRH